MSHSEPRSFILPVVNLRDRFRRLTLWNKVGALGGLASIFALPVAIALWYWPRPVPRPADVPAAPPWRAAPTKTAVLAHQPGLSPPVASPLAPERKTGRDHPTTTPAEIVRKLDQIEHNTRVVPPPLPTVHICVDGQQAEGEYQTYLNMTTDTPVQNAAFSSCLTDRSPARRSQVR